MKKMTVVWMAGLASLLAGAQTWTFTAPRAWSRTEKAATLATRADGAPPADDAAAVFRRPVEGAPFAAGVSWEADKDRFVRSYRVTSPVARKTGYSEMLDHRILSADRLVQRTTFADGTVVTVNFGETPFALPEGGTLAAGGYLVR